MKRIYAVGSYDYASKDDSEEFEDSEENWKMLDTKQVPDSDGFMTDYTLYTDGNGNYIAMFGDTDLYPPSRDEADWEGDDESEAYDWFESYKGLDDSEDGGEY